MPQNSPTISHLSCSETDSRILGGAWAGLIAGICMALIAILYSGVRGMGAWMPLENVAAAFYGPLAYVGNAGVVVIGILTHLTVALVYGAFFAWIAPRAMGSLRACFWGIAYGICVWALMTWVILPVFNETMAARVHLVPVWWFFLHLVYGGILGIFMPAARRAFGFHSALPAPSV
jgi:hypothetical protein